MRQSVDPERVRDVNRRFHDEVEAQGYDLRMGVRHAAEDVCRVIDELERVLGAPLPRGGTVVDLGAGTGNVAVKLAIDGRFERVVAVDISAGMLAEAKLSASAHAVRLETVVSDMAPLPFPDASIDLIVGCAMLHHVPDVQALMREVRRVLKPGAACVFIGEPSTWGARITGFFKWPLVTSARVVRKVRGANIARWEHDEIDVHTFSHADIDGLTCEFVDVRSCPEGLVEPLVDQAWLAPVLLLFGERPRVARALRNTRRVLNKLDRAITPIVPRDLLFSMKFSAHRG